jgi:hypothetical protein
MTATPSTSGSHSLAMARKRVFSLWFACLLTGCCLAALGLAGCSGGGTAIGTSNTDPAKATVTAFLEAIKRGDDEGARSMLTKVARAKTQEMGISVAPPVNSTATYSIRECEMVPEAEDLVHVATTWTDTDSDGFTTTENVIWAVRLDPEGWRVAGMATRIFEDMPPLLLNFEDPEDMIAKQELVAKELQKRALQAQAGQAQAGQAQAGQAQAGQAQAKQPESRTASGPADGQRK